MKLFFFFKVWGDKCFEGREAILGQLDKTLADLQVKELVVCACVCVCVHIHAHIHGRGGIWICISCVRVYIYI